MPRVGRHPLKSQGLIDEINPQKITITTLVHIPTIAGYWEQSLEVLKLHFDSLFQNTSLPFDLMVLDNASCSEVHDYLLGLYLDGRIQFLTFSKYNLRKTGAVNYLLSTAPGDFVVLTDCDIYFLPGWLEQSLRILKTFPEAGRVTALPIAGGDVTKNYAEAYEAVSNDPTIAIKQGELVPDEYVRAHSLSIGKDPEEYLKIRLAGRQDLIISRNSTNAYLGGADLQFTITRKALDNVLPIVVKDHNSVGRRFDPIYVPVLEEKLRAAGFWELSTPEYLVHHMGNTIPSLETELPWRSGKIEKDISPTNKNKRRTLKFFLLQNRIVRRVLKYVNLITYKLLYEK